MAKFNSLVLALCAITSIAAASPFNIQERQSNTTRASESSPNPIGALYPKNFTGTLNGTIAVVPIPLSLARTLIPSQYGILTEAYKQLLPGFAKDAYPLIIRSVLDHDVGINGIQFLEDFQSFHVSYPFVDLLGDGYSSFSYQKHLIISASSPIAIAGTAVYGTVPIPATFEPDLQAYSSVPGSENGEIFYHAYPVNGSTECPIATTKFKPQPKLGPWPLGFYINATNQPAFTDGTIGCDNQMMFFNTTLSTGANAPVGIKGDISVKAPLFEPNKDREFKGVYGIKVDVAFLENNLVPCKDLRGYQGTGPGDRGAA